MRRSSSIDTSWPGGRDEPMVLFGRARDIWTEREDREPVAFAEGEMEIIAASRRRVMALRTRPDFPEAQRLVGLTGGELNRGLLADVLAEQVGTPLYLLLDDYFGAALVASWAWSQWVPNWMAHSGSLPTSSGKGRPRASMEGVCAGFRPGSSALIPATMSIAGQSAAHVPSPIHPADPSGWHEVPSQEGVGMRRARRLDVWIDDAQTLHMDAGFQDSATTPDGGRVAVHEYRVVATADVRDLILSTLHVEPHILPYVECPSAIPNAQLMIGTSLEQLRRDASRRLAGTLGCTHLNDVLRSLADVPRLASEIQKRAGSGGSLGDHEGLG